MRRVIVLARKELASLAHSPVATVVSTVFLFLCGYFFYNFVSLYHLLSIQPKDIAIRSELRLTEGILQPLFENIGFVAMLIAPLLTMKLLAEERRRRSLELLLTWPVSAKETLIAKFLAAFTFYAALLVLTLAYPLFLAFVGDPDPGAIVAGYVGLLLLGAAFLACGIFVSSLTESSVVAAIGTVALLFVFWTVGWSAAAFGERISSMIEKVSLLHRFDRFATGAIDVGDFFFFISTVAIFLYLAEQRLLSGRGRV